MWKKFNFFDKHTVSDEKSIKFFSNVNVTCCTSGRSNIIFGDNKGTIHVMDRNLNTRQCKAFEQRVNHLKHVAQPNFLIAVGDDGGEAYQDVLSIYTLDKYKELSKESSTTSIGQFLKVREISIFSQLKEEPSPVTCIEANQDFNCIALGLGNGKIILFQGDFTKSGGKSSNKVFVLDGADSHITGLGFRRYGQSNDYCLFCCSLTSVFRYSINTSSSTSQRSLEQSKVMLDDQIGCEVGCSCMSNDGDFVVAAKSAVWFYKPEGKGACFAFDGKKILTQWFRTYLIIISSEANRVNASLQQVITIYDLKNKYIAFRFASEKLRVTHTLQEWGNVFLLSTLDLTPTELSNSNGVMNISKSQTMYLLEEKDTQSKLELLLQKNLYSIAINLVSSENFEYNYVYEIFKQYGDHLYSKKDYPGAMKQYIRTIGKLEASYVIRKFLDANRIKDLTNYLEALHEQHLANSDHTTLLLNCYTKLKDERKEKLDKFIRMQDELKYDVDTAIRVCKKAGYKEHALILAMKHHQHDWYIKIHLEEDLLDESIKTENLRRALKYIESLDFNDAEHYLLLYGKQFVNSLPKETTNVLIRLCVDYFPVHPLENNRTLDTDIKTMYKRMNENLKNIQLQQQSNNVNTMNNNTALNNVNNNVKERLLMEENEKISPVINPSPNLNTGNTGTNAQNNPNNSNVFSAFLGSLKTTNTTSLLTNLQPTNLLNISNHNNNNNNAMNSSSISPINNELSISPSNNVPLSSSYSSNHSNHLDDISNFQYNSSQNQQQHGVAKPEKFIHCFSTKDQYWLMIFLENVIWRSKNKQFIEHSKIVYNTLIEIYLKYLEKDYLKRPELEINNNSLDRYEIYSPMIDLNHLNYKERLLYTLDHPQSNYDKEHVLVLVQSQGFKEGVLKMYDSLGLHYYIIQYYMEQKDYRNVIQACNLYGDKDPNLWVQVLTYFTTCEEHVEEEIGIVLEKIEKEEILPPLLVVQILGKNEKTKLYTIKDYLISKIQKEEELMKEDLEKIKEYQNETNTMRDEIYNLQTSAKLFQLTTCTFCNSPLDLPAVHFMCGHSYHQRCLLVGNESECRVCSDKHREIIQRKIMFEKSSDQHDTFFKQLDSKKFDGFTVVSDYFGRGIGNVFLRNKYLEKLDEDLNDIHIDEEDDLTDENDDSDEEERRRKLLE
ncbi:hypothetical protein ABK040_000755 [Willaertia magna]